MSNSVRAGLNVFWWVLVIAMNWISNALPLNGMTQRDLSAQYPIPLTPAPYVFSIWGLIYLGLLGYVIYQALPSQRDNPRIRSLDLPFALSSLFNVAWLVAWHYQFVAVALALMLGILGSLLLAYIRLDQGRAESSGIDRWVVDSTFSMYFAWLNLATILNVSIFLYWLGWRGGPLSGQAWTVVLLLVALALLLSIGVPRRDTAMLGVLAWASFGIRLKNAHVPMIAITAWAVFGSSLLTALWCFWQNRKATPDEPEAEADTATSQPQAA